jgi:syntaxin 1B/2/3
MLFQDLATMVTEQDEILDQIVYHSDNAKNYVEQSNVELRSAVKTAKKVRRRKWCIAASCVILVVVVVLIVVFVVVPVLQKRTP